jgi:hypothetical protein
MFSIAQFNASESAHSMPAMLIQEAPEFQQQPLARKMKVE